MFFQFNYGIIGNDSEDGVITAELRDWAAAHDVMHSLWEELEIEFETSENIWIDVKEITLEAFNNIEV